MPLVGVRQKVRELRLANPHWSLGDISSCVHVSRERVRQLLKAEGLHTRRITPRAVFDAALEGRDARAWSECQSSRDESHETSQEDA